MFVCGTYSNHCALKCFCAVTSRISSFINDFKVMMNCCTTTNQVLMFGHHQSTNYTDCKLWIFKFGTHFYVTNNITKYCELGRTLCCLSVVMCKAVFRIRECTAPVARHSTVLCGYETCWHKIECNGASNGNLYTSSVANSINYRVF